MGATPPVGVLTAPLPRAGVPACCELGSPALVSVRVGTRHADQITSFCARSLRVGSVHRLGDRDVSFDQRLGHLAAAC